MKITRRYLKRVIQEEIESLLSEKKKRKKKSNWQGDVSRDIEKKGHDGVFVKWCKSQGHSGVNQSCVNDAYKAGKPWRKRASLAVTFSQGKGGAPSLKRPKIPKKK